MTPSYAGQIPRWLENNERFAKDTFPNRPQPWHMADEREAMVSSGQAGAVLTCFDPRCVPEDFFGPDFGGGAFRNAGGRVTEDAIRTFTALRAAIGLKTIMVVHHTDCGVTHVTPKEVIDMVAHDGEHAKSAAEKIDYKFFSSDELEESIKEDVRILRNAPTLSGLNIYGFKLDTFTGKVEEIAV